MRMDRRSPVDPFFARGDAGSSFGQRQVSQRSSKSGTIKTVDPWKLVAEVEELRKMWQASWDGFKRAKEGGRPASEIARLNSAQRKLRGLYLAQARAAVDASLAEHKK
jgi:hypothetical protein